LREQEKKLGKTGKKKDGWREEGKKGSKGRAVILFHVSPIMRVRLLVQRTESKEEALKEKKILNRGVKEGKIEK